MQTRVLLSVKILFLLLIVADSLIAQQSRFKEGETIYVWALSGLNMRKLPDAKSEKIAALPYGTKVVVQPNIGVIVAHEIEEFKDFKVKGVWLLVKYGDKEGFVFDGYMSRLVAPEKVTKDNNWFDKIGKAGIVYDTIRVKSEIDEENSFRYKQKYKHGIIYENLSGYETTVEKITLPNLTLFEGYIILKQLYHDDKKDHYRFDAKKKIFETKYLLEEDNKWEESEGGCEIYLKMKGTTLIIEATCGY